MGRRTGTAFTLLWALLVAGAGPAAAGGGRLAPVQERYDPGGTATVVGYTAGPPPDQPFYAYLRPAGDGSLPALDDAGRYVGELVVEETAHGGYLGLRVSLTFDVPEALAPGDYEVTYCDDPCTGTFLGDLVPSPVSIGVDPPRPVVREWAPDDPQIANLAAGALLVGPGFQTTAGAVRTPPSTVPLAPPPVPPQALAQPQAPAPPAIADDDGHMAWPVPTALVLASAAGTALVLGRRARTVATRRPEVPVAGRAGGAFAGRG